MVDGMTKIPSSITGVYTHVWIELYKDDPKVIGGPWPHPYFKISGFNVWANTAVALMEIKTVPFLDEDEIYVLDEKIAHSALKEFAAYFNAEIGKPE